MYYVAIDVGGTHCRIALIENNNKDIKILSRQKFHMNPDFISGVKELADHISQISQGEKLEGIGAGFPGIIDSKKGIMLSSANLPGWEQKPIKERLEEYLNIPTFIYHDVALAAAGEALYGHGANVDTFIFLIWGTGFGGVKIEKLLGKLHITSFEPGHYISDRNGKTCVCGQKGCPEIDIGGGSLNKKLGKDLAEIKDSDSVWNEVIEIAGQTVANVEAFHPSRMIVFGGGLILNRAFLLDKIKVYLKKNLFVFDLPDLKLSKLGDDAGLYGAVALQKIELI